MNYTLKLPHLFPRIIENEWNIIFFYSNKKTRFCLQHLKAHLDQNYN